MVLHRPWDGIEIDRDGHWLEIRAVSDRRSNRWAIGATVRVVAGQRTLVREVADDSTFSSPGVRFGLGNARAVDHIEVDFPSARTVRYEGPFDANRMLWLFESGDVHQGSGLDFG